MKTTIDIPEESLAEAMRLAGAKTKREAVLVCVAEYNQRHRMAELVKCLGTFGDDFPSHEQLERGDLEESVDRWKR
jgi:hypothetical protein